MYSLKFNFYIRLLINVTISLLEDVSFNYLGLPNGGSPRSFTFWNSLIDKIRRRLSGCNNNNLLMGCCLILLKYSL